MAIERANQVMAGKKIPFSINQNDARPLFNQVVDGFREAIISGYYAPGEKIPSSRDLCQILGVSRIVTQAALRHNNDTIVKFDSLDLVWRLIHDHPRRQSGQTCKYDFWQFSQLWKAHRAGMAALALPASSAVSFHAFWSSCRPHGVNAAHLPEGGVKSRVFQGEGFGF